METKKNFFEVETLKECDFIVRLPRTKRKSMVTNLSQELATANDEKEKMKEEIASLKEKNKKLKEEMKKEHEVVTARFDKLPRLMNGEPSSNKEHGPSSSQVSQSTPSQSLVPSMTTFWMFVFGLEI